MAIVGLIAVLVSPHEFAESDTATGRALWLGALAGWAVASTMYALPQLVFGLNLRAGTHGRLLATAIAAPIWAVLGLQPLVAGIVAGWSGISPVAVVVVAASGVLDALVFVAAFAGLRRLRQPPAIARHR
jgi:hypothetical protein